MDKKFFTADELMDTYGLSRDQIEALVGEGKLKALADRGAFKYKREEIEALLAGGLTPEGVVGGDPSDSDVMTFDFDGDFQNQAAPEVSFLELDEEALAGPKSNKDSSSDVEVIDAGDDDLMSFLSTLDDASSEKDVVDVAPKTTSTQPESSLHDLFGDGPDETAGGNELDLDSHSDVAAIDDNAQGPGSFVNDLLGNDDKATSDDESGIGFDFTGSSQPTEVAETLSFGDENDETGIRLESPEEASHSALSDSSLALSLEDSGLSLDTGDIDAGESGIILDTESSDSSLKMSTEDSDLSLDTGDSGLSLDTGDSGLSLDTGESGIILDTGESGILLDTGDSGLMLDTGDSGLSLDMSDSGLSLDMADENSSVAKAAGTQRMDLGEFAEDDFDLSDELSIQDEETLSTSAGTQRLSREEKFQEEDDFATQLSGEEDVVGLSDDDVTQMLILGDDEETAAKPARGGISDQFDIDQDVDDLEITDDLEEAVVVGGFDDDDDDLLDDDDDVVMADDDDFSEEAIPTRGGAAKAASGFALPSFGAPTTIALCLGGMFLMLNGWLVWEATATMWTGAEPSSAASSIINSLAGLIG